MRKLKFVLLLFIASILVFAFKKVPCKKKDPEWCMYVDLNQEYNPDCGCDGNTYIKKAMNNAMELLIIKRGL